MRNDITQERIRSLLDYDQSTGVFTWRNPAGRWGRIPAGSIAGSLNNKGYWTLSIDGVDRSASRIAWLYVTGSWPIDLIDHIDGDKTNNRFANLRQSTNGENLQNVRKPSRNNKSGFLGVSYDGSGTQVKKWKAHICVNRRAIRLGRFLTPQEAHQAYLSAKFVHHPFARVI